MKNLTRALTAIVATTFCGGLFGTNNVNAQSTENKPPAPVTVVNTTANPVPVMGQVNIGNSPLVDARQSGQWNVGISGTPTVQLDPNANTVQVERLTNYQRAEQVNWTGQAGDAWTTNFTDRFPKLRVCVAHTGPNPIQVNVYTLVSGSTNTFFFTIDIFVINSPNTVCKIYDAPGASTQVQILNTGNNTTGLARVGLVGN